MCIPSAYVCGLEGLMYVDSRHACTFDEEVLMQGMRGAQRLAHDAAPECVAWPCIFENVDVMMAMGVLFVC